MTQSAVNEALSDDETQKLVSDSAHSISTLTGAFPAFIIIVSYVSKKTAGVGVFSARAVRRPHDPCFCRNMCAHVFS